MAMKRKSSAPLRVVSEYLRTHEPSYPSDVAFAINATVGDVVEALNYLDRQKEVTLWIGGKWSLLNESVGRREIHSCQPVKAKRHKPTEINEIPTNQLIL
jgi:hypothetical protein